MLIFSFYVSSVGGVRLIFAYFHSMASRHGKIIPNASTKKIAAVCGMLTYRSTTSCMSNLTINKAAIISTNALDLCK